MRRTKTPLLLALAALLLDCAPLTKLEADACGNGVVDRKTEDCDGFPAGQCGAPGTPAQCRLVCKPADKDGPAIQCPQGWGCSVDNFCRQPDDGKFEAATAGVSAGVSSLLVGDFDGDRRKDIFGTSALGTTAGKGRVHYFGDGGALTQTVVLPAVITSPFVRDFDGDGLDELAFAYNFSFFGAVAGGLAVVVGQKDRTIVPRLFPSFTQPSFDGIIVEVAGDVADDELRYVSIGKGMVQGALVEGLRSVDGGYARPLPGLSTNLVAVFGGVLFRNDPSSACGEIALALNGDSPAVEIYSPCAPGPSSLARRWAPERAPVRVTLPGGERITGLHVAEAGTASAHLVIGGESGTIYRADVDGAAPAAVKPPVASTLLRSVPLASGDIDGDGLTDYVTPGSVVLSQDSFGGGDAGADAGGGSGVGYVLSPSKRWASAVVADVDGDGVRDVIGASDAQPDIDVLKGARGFAARNMPVSSVTTNGTVRQLIVKDVDGDGTNDVVFIQGRAASDEREVAIAYGRPFSLPPEAARTAGRAVGIKQILPEPFGIGITIATPAGSDLPTFSLAVMLTSGDRQPIAPLLFNDDGALRGRPKANQRDWLPRSIGAGAVAAAGRVDVVALAEGALRSFPAGSLPSDPDAYGIWAAKGGAKPGFDFTAAVEVLRLEELEEASRLRRVDTSLILQNRLGDLDGDGVEELVVVTPDTLGGAAIRIYRFDSVKQVGGERKIAVAEREITPNGRVEIVDVDGDGKLDLVAVLKDPKGVLAVNIFYNDGAGAFAVPGAVVTLPAGQTAEDVYALGFALITTSAPRSGGDAKDVRRQMAIVTPKRLFLAPLPEGRGPFQPVDVTSLFGKQGLTYGSDVAVGDFDGDGVQDLAVADSGSVRILRQKARLP